MNDLVLTRVHRLAVTCHHDFSIVRSGDLTSRKIEARLICVLFILTTCSSQTERGNTSGDDRFFEFSRFEIVAKGFHECYLGLECQILVDVPCGALVSYACEFLSLRCAGVCYEVRAFAGGAAQCETSAVESNAHFNGRFAHGSRCFAVGWLEEKPRL